MLLAKSLENLGVITGVILDFEKSGDVLPKHNHDESTAHITIVARGRLRAFSHDWSVDAEAGKILDFRAGEPHTLMALEDNTRVFNITKNPDLTVPINLDDYHKEQA
jgi:hypothetical protein